MISYHVYIIHRIQPYSICVLLFLVTEAFKMTKDTFGSLDIVVNNAGVATTGKDWERTVDINLVINRS